MTGLTINVARLSGCGPEVILEGAYPDGVMHDGGQTDIPLIVARLVVTAGACLYMRKQVLMCLIWLGLDIIHSSTHIPS